MRILLAQSSVYVPALGGANKSNKLLLEGLASRGHDCHVLAPACGLHGCATRADFDAELQTRRIPFVRPDAHTQVFELAGVHVTAAATREALLATLRRMIRSLDPDCLVIASEDPGQALLEIAVEAAADRVIYLARTTLALPCGPDAPIRDPARTRLLSRAASIVAVSRYLRDYLARWAGVDAVVLPISLNGSGPFPDHGLAQRGAILFVNPCAYKGLSIVAELARSCPDLPFVAVPSWGTTRADREVLGTLANVRVIEPTEDVERILADTRVLLVPSLWAEAKARMIGEAMLRGIPVLASDVGGNGEAMLGVDYLLPVTPIARFRQPLMVDERMLPVAEIPPQDIRPWLDALRTLFDAPATYQHVSRAARSAALAYNAGATVVPFEQHLMEISGAARGSRRSPPGSEVRSEVINEPRLGK